VAWEYPARVSVNHFACLRGGRAPAGIRTTPTDLRSDYLVSSRVGLFTNQVAARSVRRLRASAFPMDSTERRLADEIDREALVARGHVGPRPSLEAVWRRGPALLDVTVMGPAGRPLPTRALTLVANLQDRQALRYLSTST
jgi:hypothetical protein